MQNQILLTPWKEELEMNGIKCSINNAILSAKLEKKDEEGHHYVNLEMQEDSSGHTLYGNISGSLTTTKSRLTPEEAVSKFITYKLTFFSKN